MEWKNPQKSTFEPNLFKIPIEIYEECLDTESAKEKKDEILDPFKNYNKLHSEEEFAEIRTTLYHACKRGDIDLINICLSETVKKGIFSFKINKINGTASLFMVDKSIEEVIIPRTVEHESVEYLITSICKESSYLKTLEFVEDSALKTIYGDMFSSFSTIKEIYFPASLRELKEGWCHNLKTLTKIRISPMNGQFIMKEDKYLLGKSDQNKDEFDILHFANRDIEEISIPSNIKVISSCAFENCENLTKVEISADSNLQTIGSFAFKYTKIKEIYFPSSLKELKEGWCFWTHNLTKITISPLNDQFKLIDEKFLFGKSDPNSNEFDVIVFPCRDIKEFSIPSNIKIISSSAFDNSNLAKIEITTNSNLQTIEKYAFLRSNIKEIFIPSKVTKICKQAFDHCDYLTKVEIPKNSNLQTIEFYAFSFSYIKEIFIPSTVSKICESAFLSCSHLTNVEIPANSNLKIIGKKAFLYTNIKEFFVPSKVLKICEFALSSVLKVEIPTNSNLKTIGEYAFSGSRIKSIFIPSKVSKICELAFYRCRNLVNVEIAPNSNLQTVESNAFRESKIKYLFIPSKVSKICEEAFKKCINLQIIEISEESELESFPLSAFDENAKLIIMIPTSLNELTHTNY